VDSPETYLKRFTEEIFGFTEETFGFTEEILLYVSVEVSQERTVSV
jgi:hypothetical protein